MSAQENQNMQLESRIVALESKFSALDKAAVEQAIDNKENRALLSNLERLMIEMRGDLRLTSQTVANMREDQNAIEQTSEAIASKTLAEIDLFGKTMVESVKIMADSNKAAIGVLQKIVETDIKDLVSRVGTLESFKFKLHGGLVLLGAIGGAGFMKLITWISGA